MKTVREILSEFNKSKGWGTDDSDLRETIGYEGKAVWTGKNDEHRWYIVVPTVKEFNGNYIHFFDYVITGDASMSDMDLEFDLDEATVVEKKERTITEVYYE